MSYKYIDLTRKTQHAPDYVALNPSQVIPMLIAENGTLKLTQSLAILEYLKEKSRQKPLLPKDLNKRAIVRNLIVISVLDLQSVTNLRILIQVEMVGGSQTEWAKQYIQDGLDGTSTTSW